MQIREQTPLKSNVNDIMKAKREKTHPSMSASLYMLSTHRCWHSLPAKWTWQHIQNCFHAPLLPIQSLLWNSTPILSIRKEFFNHQFCRWGIARTISWATRRQQSRGPTKSVIIGHSIRDLEHCSDQPRENKDKVSQLKEYNVEYVVKHLSNGRKRKDVVWWYEYTWYDSMLACWSAPTTFCNTASTTIARKAKKSTTHKATNLIGNCSCFYYINYRFLRVDHCQDTPSRECKTSHRALSTSPEIQPNVLRRFCINAVSNDDILSSTSNWYALVLCLTWSSTVQIPFPSWELWVPA